MPSPRADDSESNATARLQARLDGILDAALDSIITIDGAGCITDFNAAAERTFGWRRADVLGREMAEIIIPAAMRGRHRAGLRRLVETGESGGLLGRRVEVTALRADGTEFPVELTITRIGAGEEVFFTAYFREDAAARLQTRFTAILDAALDCIITIDHQGNVVDFNAAASRTFGYAREQAVGREMAALIVPPAFRERHRHGLRRLIETGQSSGVVGKRIELPALHADGHEFPVELAITRVESGGGQPFFTAYLRDLTERHRSDAAQRESRSYFEKSFHSSPAFMSIASAADGKLIEVNPAFTRGAGYTREEMIGHTTLELGLWLRPEQRDEFLRRIRTERTIRDLEADFRGKTGLVRSLILNADLIELSGVACMLTVGIDVTERRQHERTQNATYQISQAMLAGGDLPALFAELHRIVAGLVSARNFYVALLSPDRALLSFPYFVDETAPAPAPRQPGFGLTEYVLQTAKPLRTTADGVTEIFSGDSRYKPTGKPSALWLGAPLMIDGRAIGVIAVQDYQNPHAYTEADLKLLMFVADQTAAAVHRQQVVAAQRESRTYFEKSFHSSPALMSLHRMEDGKFVEVNPAFTRSCGYTREEVIGRTTAELDLWARAEQRDNFLQQIDTVGFVRDLQADFRAKQGRGTTLLVNADKIELGGESCVLTVAIDVTERRRREQVQAATFQISRAVLAGGDLEMLFAEVHAIVGGLMPAKIFMSRWSVPTEGSCRSPTSPTSTWLRRRRARSATVLPNTSSPPPGRSGSPVPNSLRSSLRVAPIRRSIGPRPSGSAHRSLAAAGPSE